MGKEKNEYWKNRFDNYLAGLDRDEARLKRKLAKQTKTIAAELEKEIASFYSKYGVDNIIEYKNLTRGLSRTDYNLLMKDITRFSIKHPEYAHLIEIRKQAYKLSRLEGLHHSVLLKQVEIGAIQQEEIKEYLSNVYKGARITSLEALGVSDNFYKVDETTMQQTINKAWLDSSNFSDRIWNNTQKLTKTIQNEITNGFIRGDSYQKLASILADKMGNNVSNAMRLIRTEGTFVANEAAMEPFEMMGDIVDEYIYSSVLDRRTSDICRSLDGEKFKIKDKQPGVNFPPMHVYCRSSFEIDIPDDFVDKYEIKIEGEKTSGAGVFKPSKTLEEAETYANKFVGNGYAPHFKNKAIYKGVSLEHANEINKTFEKIYHKFDIEKINGIKTISPLSKEGKKAFKSGSDALMAYNPIEHGIYLNKDILKDAKALQKYNKQALESWDTVMDNIDKLSGKSKEIVERYRLAGRSLVGNGTIEDYLTHELGHHIQYTAIDAKTQNLLTKNMSKYSGKISGYATSSRSEYFAESFVAYTKGEIDRLDPIYVKYIKENNLVKRKLNKGKIEFVNSKIKLKPIPLEKKEYARVMSELNTHLTKEELKGGITSRAIGNYLYTVEVNSFGDYVIIGKEIIK